jgi:fatty acid desaturase
MRGAYWLSLLAVVHLSGSWPLFLLFWVVPLLTAYPFVMQLREIAHHSNAPDNGDFTNSRIFDVNPITRYCIFPYAQDFHLTHHLFMTIPHHRMIRAHEILSRHAPYREQVVICRGYFFRRMGTAGPSLLDIVSRPTPCPRLSTREAGIPSPHLPRYQTETYRDWVPSK